MADLRQPDERADEICDVPEPDPLAVHRRVCKGGPKAPGIHLAPSCASDQ